MTASFDKLVMDNEIIGMVMRAVEGIKVDEETLAFDVIKAAGPGGHFVSARHTRRHMRTEQYVPSLSDRENRDQWVAAGARDARTRAAETAKAILDAPLKSCIPEAVRETLKAEIPGLRPFLME